MFPAKSITEFGSISNLTSAEFWHEVTGIVKLRSEPVTAPSWQPLPEILKSAVAKPVIASLKTTLYASVAPEFGLLGEVICTVGEVRSMTTSAVMVWAAGPANTPVTEFANRVSLREPTEQLEATTE
jgi:hypothetical protein